MGEYETAESQPQSGLLPNGLLPDEAASMMQVLDSARWSKAEERTAELIECIKPNEPSENQRKAVASYVQQLIAKCFPCQVFTFGSVPLKTYLPDGDIDLTAFSKNQTLKESWAHQVRDMLENEEKNENAEFHVKEVQYIQAEVKIIKCLVENIVVDISFNQLGGLCTLCFLEEVDHKIGNDHLFKRSIILIKAWCYYESRILGAHHGLISTYALETLVLYIFHVFNNSFAGPLEVLYRFLEFFSKFDWDNFCVSLWGPVPISSLPNVTAEAPRKDDGDLLLDKSFLDACGLVYAVFPNGQEHNGPPFTSKHFNVIDPLRVNNNLGRSVSKGNFFRIRSAFAFGAKKLARLLECNSENIHFEVNQFFQNTWERHGNGRRPDAPINGFGQLRLSNHDYLINDISHGLHSDLSQRGNHPLESTSLSSDIALASRTQSQKINVNSSLKTSEQSRREISSHHGVHAENSLRTSKPDSLVNDLQGRFLFARTRSSPELTDTYKEVSSQSRRSKAPESKGQTSAVNLDSIKRQNTKQEKLSRHVIGCSTEDPSVRHNSSHQNPDVAESNSYDDDDSGLIATDEEFASVLATQGMHQEEQDLVNMMASSSGLGFNGQMHIPLNLASGQIPFPLPPGALASMGYFQRNFGGMVPTNIPFLDPHWAASMQFPQGLSPSQLNHYFTSLGLTSSPEGSVEHSNEHSGTLELNRADADNDFWNEHERASIADLELDNGSFEMDQSDDKQQSTSGSYHFVHSSRIGGSGSSSRVQPKSSRESHSSRGDHVESYPHGENRSAELLDERLTGSPTMSSNSLRSRAGSESSWDGLSVKTKSAREKRGRKAPSDVTSVVYATGKAIHENASIQADDDTQLSSSPEIVERGFGPPATGPLHVSRRPMPGLELAQTSESDSLSPIAPVILSHGARFYPTGPPVPFVTMLPIYKFPTERGTSDASTSQFSSEENNEPCQNGDLRNSMRVEEPFEHKFDILNSDFASHWQNLQFGRFCQDPPLPSPLSCPSPVVVPPVYLQGRSPWDGPGRPISPNMNLVSQLMGYGPRILPVASVQAVPNRPTAVYQPYVDEVPRYRGGTGTYLPNPQKVAVRDRHSPNSRKSNYNYDRNDYHHGDREGNWNNSKSRGHGRSQSRNQADKSRSDRTWVSHRHDTPLTYQSQNGPTRPNASQVGSANMAYGMYPITSGGLQSNGQVVMLYPYNQNTAGYVSSADQIEFGSLGPVGHSGVNDLNEGSRSGAGFEEQRFHSSAVQLSSPDQPSSPHFRGS
ncbi:hypothetical protein LINPERPRIM_LOCUS27634 [Linum perenne]